MAASGFLFGTENGEDPLCDIKPGLKKKGARTWETKEGQATQEVPRQQELCTGKRISNRQQLERKCQPEGRHGRHCDGGLLPLAPLLLFILLVQPLQEEGGDGGASAHQARYQVPGLLTCLLITRLLPGLGTHDRKR